MIQQDIDTRRGDHDTWEGIAKDEDTIIVDITGATIVFSVSKKSASLFANNKTVEIADYIIRKTTDDSDEIEITDAAIGEYQVKLIPADTQELKTQKEGQEYLFDVEMTTAAGRVKTLVGGDFIIDGDVSRPTA